MTTNIEQNPIFGRPKKLLDGEELLYGNLDVADNKIITSCKTKLKYKSGQKAGQEKKHISTWPISIDIYDCNKLGGRLTIPKFYDNYYIKNILAYHDYILTTNYGTIILWDYDSTCKMWKIKHKINDTCCELYDLVADFEDECVYSSGLNGIVKKWSMPSLALDCEIDTGIYNLSALCITPKLIIAASEEYVLVLDKITHKPINTYELGFKETDEDFIYINKMEIVDSKIVIALVNDDDEKDGHIIICDIKTDKLTKIPVNKLHTIHIMNNMILCGKFKSCFTSKLDIYDLNTYQKVANLSNLFSQLTKFPSEINHFDNKLIIIMGISQEGFAIIPYLGDKSDEYKYKNIFSNYNLATHPKIIDNIMNYFR